MDCAYTCLPSKPAEDSFGLVDFLQNVSISSDEIYSAGVDFFFMMLLVMKQMIFLLISFCLFIHTEYARRTSASHLERKKLKHIDCVATENPFLSRLGRHVLGYALAKGIGNISKFVFTGITLTTSFSCLKWNVLPPL